MAQPIVECIANYSEARRPEVVDAISLAIRSVEGVRLLDRHSDLDHNRTVLTFVGPPQKIEEAAYQSIAKAANLIDLDVHRGEHPRIGATDVVPFVPISGIEMKECVEMARRLGKRVGEELGIAVYLYEEAATRPDRQNLENIRRGQYEGLKTEIVTNPDRCPDFGPARLTPAGATVIGARQPLIAYNVYLTTDDVAIARKIAKAVRNSSGGMRFVKALGLLVEGRAQVSMNLTNYHETPVARVVEMIRREAERYGTGIHHCELVGLIPEDALVEAAVWYLQLDQFEAEQILERKLYAAAQADESGADANGKMGAEAFLDALAAGTAAPGGGSAAAYSGAAGAALVAMVARLTIGKKKYSAVEAEMQRLLDQAEGLRLELTESVKRDAAAFDALMAAFKLPKETPEEQGKRAQAIEEATLIATQEPLKTAQLAVQVMELGQQVVHIGNLNAITDAGTAVALARAALAGAGLNVRTNLKSLQNQAAVSQMTSELSALEAKGSELEAGVRSTLQERGGLAFA
jgi:glutamate formiminotransferase / formiminotetrahydrofolate cyclodeaminase